MKGTEIAPENRKPWSVPEVSLRSGGLALLALLSMVCLPVFADSCCGPVSSGGLRLEKLLDSLEVERHWLAHEHVDWQSGLPDKGPDYDGPGRATHCSAFAAAVAERLGVYLLRPPQHAQILLATAQGKWLASTAGALAGWKPVPGAREAQTRANQGELIVAVFQSAERKKPGHVAILRPAELSDDELSRNGPRITQAGQRNFSQVSLREGFRHHAGAWPDGVRYFAHIVAE